MKIINNKAGINLPKTIQVHTFNFILRKFEINVMLLENENVSYI